MSGNWVIFKLKSGGGYEQLYNGYGADNRAFAGIGLILGVDRLLDMSRTVVNVWGDAVGAKIISRSEPDVAA